MSDLKIRYQQSATLHYTLQSESAFIGKASNGEVVGWRRLASADCLQELPIYANPRNKGVRAFEMEGFRQLILRTDMAGMPLEWVDYRDAVRLHFLDQIAYTCGRIIYRIHGGVNAHTHRQSIVNVNSIIATHGNSRALEKMREGYIPPLNNHTLFQRDGHLCLYCGHHLPKRLLSRDHVRPLSQGGPDSWNNVVTACIRCNNHKAGRTPEAAGMELLAIPFIPTHAEYIYLQGHNVLADQMEFLRAHFPRTSPLHSRLGQG